MRRCSLPEIAPKKMESLVNLMMASSSLARPISAPPGLPPERAKVLREAVWKAMNDPEEILKEARRAIKDLGAVGVQVFSNVLGRPLTRPETMLGDTAVAVNPKDERYKHLVGKKLVLPLT
jgi:hypothetical protein